MPADYDFKRGFRDAEGDKNMSRETGSGDGDTSIPRGFRDPEVGAVNRSRSTGSGDGDVSIQRGFRDSELGGANRSRSTGGDYKKTNPGSSGEGGN